MRHCIADYRALVFDCDGVVLDSNGVKTKVFYQATLRYGESAAKAMVEYHVANGGISRYKKFAHFLENIAPACTALRRRHTLEVLLEVCAGYVREGLLTCDIAPGLEILRQQTCDARWFIVSGGDQADLRDVFSQRGIASWFDGGIFGSPDTKDEILQRELVEKNIQLPALFLGDSKYGSQAATAAGLDFVVLSGWREVADWKRWVEEYKLVCVACVGDMVHSVALESN